MDVQLYTRPRTLGDLLAYELDQQFCRDSVTFLAGASADVAVPKFSVLGATIESASCTSAVKASGANTGTGTSVPDSTTPILSGAVSGKYALRCTVAGTNSATFRLSDPNGRVLKDYSFSGSGAVLTTDDQIKVAITDGGTDFIVGDGFDITVDVGSPKYQQLNLTGTDGSQTAAGVSVADVTRTNGVDVSADILARGPLVVRAEELIWPAGITTAQTDIAVAQLALLGILVRTSG